MTFEEYIPKAIATAVFIDGRYPSVSLLVESAELLDVFVKPLLRGDNNGKVDRDKLIKEAGDCCWNLAAICHSEGITPRDPPAIIPRTDLITQCINIVYCAQLIANIGFGRRSLADVYRRRLITLLLEFNITESEVLEANLKKLADRAARGVLKGSGGER